MTRPADLTRADLVEAAVTIFATKGFDAGSVRDIAGAAGANAAAVSYHFGGKEGLYREVLRRSVDAFDIPALGHEALASGTREEAVRAYFVAQLSALRRHNEVARYLRIFAWESVSRTKVFADFLATERLPLIERARAIVERFLTQGSEEDLRVATIWLLHQVEPFIRNPDHVVGPPFGFRADAAFVAGLAETLTTLVAAGLEALAKRSQRSAVGAVA